MNHLQRGITLGLAHRHARTHPIQLLPQNLLLLLRQKRLTLLTARFANGKLFQHLAVYLVILRSEGGLFFFVQHVLRY